MIYWTTANGDKIKIFLEEASVPYKIVSVSNSKGISSKRLFLR